MIHAYRMWTQSERELEWMNVRGKDRLLLVTKNAKAFVHRESFKHAPNETHTHTVYRFGGFDIPIVNINYNEVYKHCLFIVMYYDVQWSDYRRTFISLDSIHSHNILVGSVYSLKWLHIYTHTYTQTYLASP